MTGRIFAAVVTFADGTELPTVPWDGGPDNTWCPRCECAPGEYHRYGCDMELCPRCGEAIGDCDCGIQVPPALIIGWLPNGAPILDCTPDVPKFIELLAADLMIDLAQSDGAIVEALAAQSLPPIHARRGPDSREAIEATKAGRQLSV